MTKEIKLTQGKVALIDDDMFDYLNQWKWYFHKYAERFIRKGGRKIIKMHRLILNPPPGFEIDHINRNKLDNRRCNLRVCTRSENRLNTNAPITNKSGFKGVFRHGKKWTSAIYFQHKKYYLGTFDNPFDASMAYSKKSQEFFGG